VTIRKAGGTAYCFRRDRRFVRLRIDAEPGAKRFQGVWLEVADRDERWLVDYRANPLWRSFADRAVVVTGHPYAPDPRAQAVRAPHFEIERMCLTDTPMGSTPLRAIGPKQQLAGTFVSRAWPDTAKLAGSAELVFESGDTSYVVASLSAGISPGPATVTARIVDPDPTYAAITGDPQLWILDVSP
jgi:hypothetical protein